jgi:hypothetical protein
MQGSGLADPGARWRRAAEAGPDEGPHASGQLSVRAGRDLADGLGLGFHGIDPPASQDRRRKGKGARDAACPVYPAGRGPARGGEASGKLMPS